MKRTTLLLITVLWGSFIAGCTFDEAAAWCSKTFDLNDEYSACMTGLTSIEAQNQELCTTAYRPSSGRNDSLFEICTKAAEKYSSAKNAGSQEPQSSASTPSDECKASGAYKCRY